MAQDLVLILMEAGNRRRDDFPHVSHSQGLSSQNPLCPSNPTPAPGPHLPSLVLYPSSAPSLSLLRPGQGQLLGAG